MTDPTAPSSDAPADLQVERLRLRVRGLSEADAQYVARSLARALSRLPKRSLPAADLERVTVRSQARQGESLDELTDRLARAVLTQLERSLA